MMPKQEEYFLNRFTLALNRPVQYRCAELTVLFDRASMKDLHAIFPTLVESIFGHSGCPCWDLQTITNEVNAQDFQALLHFLSPLGPLFKIIYTLLRDPLIKFEYGLNLLPEKLRNNLQQLKLHPFYADLIRIDTTRNMIVCLSLNPFDYYMFHFAYHIIDPYYIRNRMLCGTTTWGSLYYNLCCDYILHFLPTDPGCAVTPVLHVYNGKNPLYTVPLFKQQDSPPMMKMPMLDHHPRNEIWRSETIMTVFVDMWLNSDQILTSNYDFGGSFNMSAVSPYKPKLNLNEIPTGEYIRIIRVLVKQLHSFASSAKADDSYMRELKKIVVPYLQGKMYTFLRHLIYRWPLDGSFRLVLELWLSFIQPWRYPGNEYLKLPNPRAIHADVEDMSSAPMKAVDQEYMKFMADNLLSYTVILQQILPRFIRVDLSSPKLALILFRLTKVFAQPNLVPYLREIETNSDTLDSSPVHPTTAPFNVQNLPPLSPTVAWSLNAPQNQHPAKQNLSPSNANCRINACGRWLGIVKQRILELEGPGFCYKSIFCNTPAPEVYELLQHIKQCEQLAQKIISTKIDEARQNNKGIIGWAKSFFMLNECTNDEFTMEERNKIPLYLQASFQNLIDIFQIPDYTSNYSDDFSKVHGGMSGMQDIGALLTPRRVFERVKNIKYEGDPDLCPIRSNECHFLVRLLFQISSKINGEFQSEITSAYYKTNILGQLAQQVLQPPTTIYKYEKADIGHSPRVSQHLPPRFSFREFGSHKFIFYAVLFVLASKLFTSSYLYVPFLIFLAYASYIFIKAISCSLSNNNTEESEDHFVDALDTLNMSDSFY